jgi:hypothetical protein
MLWWNLRKLRSGDPKVRRTAVIGIGRSDRPEATAALISALKDADPSVRKFAVEALSHRGDKDKVVVASLLSALMDTNPPVQGAAIEAIARTHDPDAIAMALHHEFSRVGNGHSFEKNHVRLQLILIRALINHSSRSKYIENFVEVLDELDYDVRYEAAKALVRIGDARGEFDDRLNERLVGNLVIALKGSWVNGAPVSEIDALTELAKVGPAAISALLTFIQDWNGKGYSLTTSGNPSMGRQELTNKVLNFGKSVNMSIHFVRQILECGSGKVREDDLHKIAALTVIRLWFWTDESPERQVKEMDCSHIAQLARQELGRRAPEEPT